MLRSLILAFASLTPSTFEPSSGEEGSVRLQWDAPLDCPSSDHVRQKTEALLGRGLDDPRHPEVDASVTVRREARRWTAALALVTHDGRSLRALRAGSCEAVADAVALLLAMTIDPTAQLSALAEPDVPAASDRGAAGIPEAVPVEARSPAPTTARAVGIGEPPRAASTSPLPVPAHPRRPRGFAAAAFNLNVGGAPALTLGATGAAGLLWPRARLLFVGSYAAPVKTLDVATGVRLIARQGWAAVAGCGVIVRRRVELPLCGGWFAGAIHAVARGLDGARAVRLPWTGALLGAGFRHLFHPNVAAMVDVFALVPVTRPSFVIEGLGVVHQAASVAATAQLGLEIRFP